MRLNFSGVGDEEIREGVRRIGKVIAEQVELYGALTHTAASSAAPGREAEEAATDSPRPGAAGDDPDSADVLPFRRAEG
jgi:2-aminoadipate transaminase